jgi:hypothetical protein
MMKDLLTHEMVRALHLMAVLEKDDFSHWEYYKELAELKQILKSIRRHSILLEKEELK